MRLPKKRSIVAVLLAMSAVACQGAIGEAGGERRVLPPVEATPGDPIGVTGIRRLSPLELRATLSDLFGELGVPLAEPLLDPPLPAMDTRHQFSNSRESGHLTFEQVRGLAEWTESLSEAATENVEGLLGCSPTNAFDDCMRAFAETVGTLTFRRPTAAEDITRFETVFAQVMAEGEVRDGVRAILELALLSPDFWYLSAERGEDGRLTAHAVASQLSYGLWGTMPDADLRARALAGELADADGVRAVAERMMEDERAAETIQRFHREWLDLASVEELDKDPELYPTFGPEMAVDLGTEFDAFVRRAVLDGMTIQELFSNRQGYVNARLEGLYGLPPVSSGDDDWHWRELGEERAGVLTRPLFLASTAGRGESALIHRGVAVIEHLLCTVLIAPPNATEEAVDIPPDATSGKMAGVENRASKPNCRSCHTTIDPIGVAFETFDAIGAFRQQYPDRVAIEPAGVLASSGFIAGSIDYADAAELNLGLSRSPEVQECYASKWMEHLTGQSPNGAQRHELSRLASMPDITIRQLLIEVLISPMFLERAALTEDQP